MESNVLFYCPPGFKTTTLTFEATEYAPYNCAGCGCPLTVHIVSAPPDHADDVHDGQH